MTAVRVYFLRHGESESNVAGTVNDDPGRPVGLTPRGRRQAQAAAERLRGVAFSAVYCSEFPRARQTAEIVLAGLGRGDGLRLQVDSRLNERRSGMDGRPVEDFNGLVRSDPVHVRPERGESFLEQMRRLRAFLDDLAATQPGGVILAVSHENPILAATAVAGRDPAEAARGGLANCAWLALDWPVA